MQAQQIFFIVIVVVFVARLAWRMSRVMRIPMGTIWVIPAIMGAVALFVLGSLGWSVLVALCGLVGAGIGVGAGLLTARHSNVTFDVPNKSVLVKANPISILIYVGVLAIRFTTRGATIGHGLLLTECATAGLICLAACMIIATRYDWCQQFRRAEKAQPGSPSLDSFGNTVG